MSNRLAQAVLTAITFVALLSTATRAKAQTVYVWNGPIAGDGLWSNGANWTPSAPISSTTDTVVGFSFDLLNAIRKDVILDTNFNVFGLQFTGGGFFAVPNYTLNNSGGSILNIGGGGILIDSGAKTINAPLTLAASQIWSTTSSGLFTVGGTVGLGANTLTVDGTGNTRIAGAISGAGGLTKTAAGTLTLGSNSYTGKTAINGGTISISSNTGLGAAPGALVADQISFTNGAKLQVTANSTFNAFQGITFGTGGGEIEVTGSAQFTYATSTASVFAGTGAFTKTGTGVLQVVGFTASTFSGPININAGVLEFTGSGSRFGVTGTVTLNGGTLRYGGTGVNAALIGTTRPLAIGPNNGTIDVPNAAATTIASSTSAFNISTFTLNKTGAGALLIARPMTGTGTINVNAGVLRLNSDHNRLPSGASLNILTGATFDMVTFNQTIGSINGGGSIVGTTAAVNRITTGGNNATTAFSGNITHGGGLTKEGTGTLILSGNNSYTGTTIINNGQLNINGSHIGTGTTTVGATGTLGGGGSMNSQVIVNGAIAPGNSIGALTVNSTVTFNTGSNYVVELAATGVVGGGNSDVILHQGMTINGGTINGGNLLFTPVSGTPAHTDVFTIAFANDNQPVTGNFAGLPDGSVVGTYNSEPLYIYYNQRVTDAVLGTFATKQGNVILTPVPEPTTILAIGALAFGAAGGIRRLRRREMVSPALAA